MGVSADDLRRRVAGWRRAELREHTVRAEAGPLRPDDALNAALELYDLLPTHLREPDETRARETTRARRVWRTLRMRLKAS